MRRDKGFTLIELMVVIAILGILTATAYPTYRTFMKRAVGAEASRIIRQLVNAQIIYFLEKGDYFPNGSDPGETSIEIYHNDPPTDPDIQRVKDALKVMLSVGHHLNYLLQYDEVTKIVDMQITADFPIFKNGHKGIQATLDSNGNVTYTTIP